MNDANAHDAAPSTAAGWGEATRLVRGGLARSGFSETSEALYLNAGYVYDTAAEAEAAFSGDIDRFVYSRYGNPTVEMFQERLRLLEGAEACTATASGMAAVFTALFSPLRAGHKVVSSRALFGSCHVILTEILPRFGVETILVDGPDLAQWEAAFEGGARLAFCETPSNPTLELVDIAAVAELAHAAGAQLVVDNVFATPVLQKPLELGADVVVYSATKHIDGQGRTMGGAVLASQEFTDDYVIPHIRHTGPTLAPFNAWTMLKGLETIKLRVEAASRNAERIAGVLADDPRVESVRYPTHPSHPQADLATRQMAMGSTLVAFTPHGGKAAAFALQDRLGVIDISNNLGDTKSLMTHPATTTHRRLGPEARAEAGIGEGLLRLSVGIEDIDDLLADLDRALG